MSDTTPVILIGLDAAEIDVVDRLVADGRMPNLARLRQQGRWGRLQTEPPNFLSLVWSQPLLRVALGEQGWSGRDLGTLIASGCSTSTPRGCRCSRSGSRSTRRTASSSSTCHTPRPPDAAQHDDAERVAVPRRLWARCRSRRTLGRGSQNGAGGRA